MKKIILLNLLLTFACWSLYSQTENILVPSDLKQQTIVTEPATLRGGFFRVGLVGSIAIGDKYFDEYSNKNYLFESAWGTNLSFIALAQYGISDRLMVEFWLPYRIQKVHFSQKYILPGSDTDLEVNWDQKGQGLSDITASLAYQILTETQTRPALIGSLYLGMPTGQKNPSSIDTLGRYDLPTGSGEFELQMDLRIRKIKYPIAYKGYIAYWYRFPGQKLLDPWDNEESRFKSGDRFIIGGSLDFHLNEWLAVANDLNYFYTGKGEEENVPDEELSDSWGIAYEGRLVFQIRRFRLAQAVSVLLKGKNQPSDPIYVMLVQYTF